MTLIENAFVTIIIPCRNEVQHISSCLESLIGNSFTKNRMQILVVDGMSDDGTRERIGVFSAKYPFVQRLDNIRQITPAALNIGIRKAKGDIIIRMDAHARYPKNYVQKLLEWMDKTSADNVGGVVVTRAGRDGLIAKAIAIVMSHPFGVGNSYFRIGTSEPRWVDTVPFGCYKRAVFDRIGMFDEELVRNQDDEFNSRLIKAGGKILLTPDIKIEYIARTTLRRVWRMYWQYGYYKPLAIRKVGAVVTVRQVVPATFVLTLGLCAIIAPFHWLAGYALLAISGAYLLTSLFASVLVARRFGAIFVVVCPVVFAVVHSAFGTGFLRGVWDFGIRRQSKTKRRAEVRISR
ncbi:MAG: glycosyltransferase family 2 protein [Halobacteriota archaeon]